MVEVPPPVPVSDLPEPEPMTSSANLWVLAVGVASTIGIIASVRLVGALLMLTVGKI